MTRTPRGDFAVCCARVVWTDIAAKQHRQCQDRREWPKRWAWKSHRVIAAALLGSEQTRHRQNLAAGESEDAAFPLRASALRSPKKAWRERQRRPAPARLRAANAVEDLLGVAREDDVVQRKQRRADNVHAAHEFIGAAIGVDSPDHHRDHLECLGRSTAGERESALNILEIQSVGLALFLDFLR